MSGYLLVRTLNDVNVILLQTKQLFENISLVLILVWYLVGFFFTAVYDCIGKLASSSQSIIFSTETIVTVLSKFSYAAEDVNIQV